MRALGWLLDPQPTLRVAVGEALAHAAREGRLSPTALRRLIAVRNWLPTEDRDPLDAAIRGARRKGLEPEPAIPAKLVEALGSGFDGSGAGSFFVLVKLGSQYAVGSLLLKLGMGVRDAWVQRDLTKAQADDLLEELANQIELVPVAPDLLRRTLPHFLGVNAASGLLPPFGTLDVIETTGLGTVNPRELSIEALLSEILPDAVDPDAVERTLAASADWLGRHAIMESWFEDGAPVELALKGKKSLSRARKTELVLEQVIAPRRRRWAEVLAWTALITLDGGDKDIGTGLALVAREVLGARAVSEVPLLGAIADATVEAWRQRRA